MTNALLHVNAEMPTKWGNAYAKVGQFYDGKGVAGQVGFRYPYLYTGTDKNGYYLGGFVGHVENDIVNFERYNRLGVGMELSYVWLNSDRLAAASVAVAFGEHKESNGVIARRTQPMILFGYSFNIGVF
jgi:hypothetical protein